MVCVLTKGKSNIQRELDLLKESQEREAKIIYDEIKPIHKVSSAAFNTKENSAYRHITRMCI